ncbi:uncharacterized protein [Panulirus ornatus]|uniref:uncharacterized protein isoform X2 n=1 Tax=Panulirus ornatus TaxID=150431 RepID=UPI003A898704
MKPADLSPRNDDGSSQDSSLDNEEGSSRSAPRSSSRSGSRTYYCTICHTCSPDGGHHHTQSNSESPRVEAVNKDTANNNTTINNTANNNTANNSTANNNTANNNPTAINNTTNKNITNNKREEGVDPSDSEGPCGDSETESDAPKGRLKKPSSGRASMSGMESPHDVDLMEVIKIPEVSTRRPITEVLSQVVKLERSSSSSASELTRTSEAPDIVTSTTKGRARKMAPPKRASSGEQRGADVTTLAILCQHYAQLVQALKEENYLLSCARSLPATPKSNNSRGATSELKGRPHPASCNDCTNKGIKGNFTWESEMIKNSEQHRPAGTGKQEVDASTPLSEHCKLISDLQMPNSPRKIKVQRSISSSRDNYNSRNSPKQSPARVKDSESPYANPGADLPKDRRPWNLKPLRSNPSRHKRDSKHHRKSSFSFFRESKDAEKVDTGNATDSPLLRRNQASTVHNPTVGVLSSKISEMEVKIQEILKLEPIDLILRENSLDRSPARRSLGSGGSLRRSASVGQRGDFYRHSVRDTRKDQRHQDGSCESDDVGEEGWRKGCGAGGGCQYQALAQAAHVEVDKLRQLVQLLNTRLTELSGRMLEAEAKLREEQQRAAIMERCLERRSLESGRASGDAGSRRGRRSPGHSSERGGRRHRPALLAWGDAATETLLRNKVDMAREEIELLRQHIDLLLRMRQEDLKVYESTVDKFRHTIASGTQW